ncbi:MAG: hypothetical protein EOO44_17515 [Flavobacterium sp.]|nr:MAG: hypothetical protein EOO44_17515 [Flavobacterium sp.]
MNKELSLNLITELLEAINKNNLEVLKTKFQISEAVYEEINEVLNSYFINSIPKLYPNKNRFEMFKYENSEDFGIEIDLEVKNEPTELTLHTELHHLGNKNYELRYRLIEVM